MTSWMLVEDEPDLYEMLLAMTQTMGVNGIAFPNGEEAFDWIEDVDAGMFQGEVPELALLDIRLPGEIDGPMVGARLRKSPTLSKTRIILITAYRLSQNEENAVIKRAGAEFLLYKPLPSFKELERILKGRRKRSHS
ncbi:MAG TPA: response regulator [Oceanobacillus sp.]|nr:response regulator [Oceanobacillus sp.]